jgi:succinate dehydrogenase flavin-adding protein (antitoxin of CptAB toxin-antitoxin module)
MSKFEFLLAAAEGKWDLMYQYLEKDPLLKDSCDNLNHTAAMIAARNGNIKVVMGLFSNEFLAIYEDVFQVCRHAASFGNLNIVQAIFLSPYFKESEKERRRNLYISAMRGAVSQDHINVVQWVAKHVPLDKLLDDKKNNLLHHCEYKMIKWLISSEGGRQKIGIINTTGGDPPLEIMAKNNDLEMVQYMVDVEKADTSILGTPYVFHFLLNKEDKRVLEWLMVNGHVDANMIVDKEPAFFHVAKANAYGLLRKLFDLNLVDVTHDASSVWLAVDWNYLLMCEEQGREFIDIVAPILMPPDTILEKLKDHKLLGSWLRASEKLRALLVKEKERRWNAMKDFIPPNDVRHLIMGYDTLPHTNNQMWQIYYDSKQSQ